MTYDAVLLDSDGVLVEPPAPSTMIEVARTALDRTGVTADPMTVVRSVQTGQLADLADHCRETSVDIASFCQQAARAAFDAQRRELDAGCRSVYDDVRALRELESPIGVVSDNQPQFVQYVLQSSGLSPLIETVRCRPFGPLTLDRRKPNPENLAAAVSDLEAETAVYVGDTAADIEAARNLGIDSVLLHRGNKPDLDETPTHRIESLRELPTIGEV